MKPSQLYYRFREMLGLRCCLEAVPDHAASPEEIRPVDTVEELDLDPVFLARFPAGEFMAGKVTFLHESEEFHWRGRWEFPERSGLWNFNLHYFEYLFPLVKAYRDTGEEKYPAQIRECVAGWLEGNPQQGGGPGWEPYTIALRLTNWLSCYSLVPAAFREDAAFLRRFVESIHEQYVFISQHLEKDLLGNHYFEDLKALVLCALFFDDGPVLAAALKDFKAQCREQILPDGMHFELSPMYHKIILEDVMRVAAALRGAGREDREIEAYLPAMLDVAYSLEEGLERLPLFNDCGSNVAKSLEALCLAAKVHFGLEPRFKAQMPDSGYYIFKRGAWKLVVDAGRPGPDYIPGHAHCDAMSFELFRAGRPVLVNCGTYAYQCAERGFFRSTAAHNTVMADGVEQSQCWGAFRLARRSRTRVLEYSEHGIKMEMTDQKGNVIRRSVAILEDSISISDRSEKRSIVFLHAYDPAVIDERVTVSGAREMQTLTMYYAPEFGRKSEIVALRIRADAGAEIGISLKGE